MAVIVRQTAAWDLTTDVLVIGGGGAGLSAALAAAQGGAETLVLEKMPRPLSNTARSGGMIPAAGTRFQRAAGVTDSAEDFARDVLEKNHGSADRATVRHMAETSRELVEWLVDRCDVKLTLVGDFKYPGHTRFRMHAPPSRTGAELVSDLKNAVRACDRAALVEGATGTGLVVDAEGVVCGATADQGGERLLVGAKKVVLACNGFAGNPSMVAEHIPEMAGAYYFGGEGSTGEALRWGEALGAELAFMDGYQCHSTVAVPGDVLITYAVVMEGGVQLNAAGRRFADETRGYSEHALSVLAQPPLDGAPGEGPVGRAWVVFDARIHAIAQGFDDYRAACEVGLVKRAEDEDHLARICRLDPAEVRRTLAAYRQCARDGARDEFGRRDCRELNGTLYGVKVTAALFHTQGGLRVDEHARVLRPDLRTIDNLYAAGGCAAGISGRGPGGYLSGNGLLTALGYGMLAGRHAAREVRAST